MLTANALCLYCALCKVLTDVTSTSAMQEKAMPTTFSENLNKCGRILENHPYGRILHIKYLALKSSLKI